MRFLCSMITKSGFYRLLFYLIVWILFGGKSLEHGHGNCKYFKGKKIAWRIWSEKSQKFLRDFLRKSCSIAVNKCCENLNLKYFLFSLISNHSLACSNLLLKSLVDGDILLVFWFLRNYNLSGEKWEKKTFFFKTFKVMRIKCHGKSKNEVSQKELQKLREFLWHFLPATFFSITVNEKVSLLE